MPKKILVADDSATMRKAIELTFATDDFAVTAVSSVDEALTQAKVMAPRPDIVIADLSLPGKDGYDLCETLKKQGTGIPVLLLHGSAAPYDEMKGKAAGADGEIAKPFETQVLIDKVTELLSAQVALPEQPALEALAPPIESQDLPAAPRAPEPPKPVEPPIAAPPPPTPAAVPPMAAMPATQPSVPDIPPAPTAHATPPQEVVPQGIVPQEIVIEAEPPPPTGPEPMPPFDVQFPLASPGLRAGAPKSTIMGLGGEAPDLPPPPAGLPLPPTVSPAPTAVASENQTTALVSEIAALHSRLAQLEETLKTVQTAGVGAGAGATPAAAVAAMGRDVVERVAWEVVPDLAETIIREELDRLVEKRAK